MIEESADDLLQTVRAAGVRQVRVLFLDYNGLSRARSVGLDNLDGALRRGVNFSSPTVDFNSRDLFTPDAAFDLASPDFWALPDPTTYMPAPAAPGVGQLLSNLVTARGEPWDGCPRTALRRVDERARGSGIVFQAGFEPEGYIFRLVDGEVQFAGTPGFATAEGLDLEPAFMEDLLGYLSDAHIAVEQWSEEYGPGQIEVNLRYGEALASADRLVAFREAFRAVARRHGLHGTFMPKPFGDIAGSGLHVHLSATPPSGAGTNLFDDPHADFGLSTIGRQALAGILAHGQALIALGASTVNSYKRFLPGSWAPTHVTYDYASRAAFVRIPERETARRLEVRSGDGACNPYIYLAGILAAALDGITRQLDPGSPVRGDVGKAAPPGTPHVPRTLAEALDRLGEDDVMRAALGNVILDEFIKIKRSEWDDFTAHVGAWDRDWYLWRY